MKVYHVTFTNRVRSIKKLGLRAGLPTNWKRHDGALYLVGAYIYAFENYTDAVLWAAKMGWAFEQNSAASQISILTIDDALPWQQDNNDPLTRAACFGNWLRRRATVQPRHIVHCEVLTSKKLREATNKKFEEWGGAAC